MNHTPTPWLRRPGNTYFERMGKTFTGETIKNSNGEIWIAHVWQGVGVDQQEANAAFIVRACNSHDDLVSALGACQMALLGYTHQNDITQKALALAQSALSKSNDTK